MNIKIFSTLSSDVLVVFESPAGYGVNTAKATQLANIVSRMIYSNVLKREEAERSLIGGGWEGEAIGERRVSAGLLQFSYFDTELSYGILEAQAE